ncbi:MAG: hypothetical protein EHM47_06060 [Ignavibacteriales bacterium]|nr:MAG: hypothetical protein EHM47_06060 [Ignavibacteriales bacterium]
MKTIITSAICFICLLTVPVSAQDLNVHNYINKNKSEVTKKYGKPVHQDVSNPEMICMFYKGSSGSMIFVSDKEGIYQSEAQLSYSSESEARRALDTFIKNSVAESFAVDSVTTSDFKVEKPGVKVDLQIYENKLSKKFEVKVKAHRTTY